MIQICFSKDFVRTFWVWDFLCGKLRFVSFRWLKIQILVFRHLPSRMVRWTRWKLSRFVVFRRDFVAKTNFEIWSIWWFKWCFGLRWLSTFGDIVETIASILDWSARVCHLVLSFSRYLSILNLVLSPLDEWAVCHRGRKCVIDFLVIDIRHESVHRLNEAIRTLWKP